MLTSVGIVVDLVKVALMLKKNTNKLSVIENFNRCYQIQIYREKAAGYSHWPSSFLSNPVVS